MEFPKQLMSIKELSAMGFSEHKLRDIASEYSYPLIVRENTKRTSKLMFDTKEFNSYLKRVGKMMERGNE